MNPNMALMELCERFLEQYPEEDRASYLDEIADRITGMSIGMDAPYPKTVRALVRRIQSLMELAGKWERVKRKYLEMDGEELSGDTLEGLAASLED